MKKEKLQKFNNTKQFVMVIGQEDINSPIKLNEETIKQIETFKYLGLKIHTDMKNESNERIENKNKLYHAIPRNTNQDENDSIRYTLKTYTDFCMRELNPQKHNRKAKY